MIEFFCIISFLWLVFWPVHSYRNRLVYTIKTSLLHDREFYHPKEYKKLPSYDDMFKDYTCWTKKQFFKKHHVQSRIVWTTAYGVFELLDKEE